MQECFFSESLFLRVTLARFYCAEFVLQDCFFRVVCFCFCWNGLFMQSWFVPVILYGVVWWDKELLVQLVWQSLSGGKSLAGVSRKGKMERECTI